MFPSQFAGRSLFHPHVRFDPRPARAREEDDAAGAAPYITNVADFKATMKSKLLESTGKRPIEAPRAPTFEPMIASDAPEGRSRTVGGVGIARKSVVGVDPHVKNAAMIFELIVFSALVWTVISNWQAFYLAFMRNVLKLDNQTTKGSLLSALFITAATVLVAFPAVNVLVKVI